ncbi:hypothetical protein TPENAI_60773 [Tenacibaculum litopenaei]
MRNNAKPFFNALLKTLKMVFVSGVFVLFIGWLLYHVLMQIINFIYVIEND